MAIGALTGIADMFAGENVFITGGSGFMGKVLLEKILRSCSEVNTVFILMRPKKGKNAQERLKDIIDTPLFQPLMRQNPKAVDKIQVVAGDCSELRLGLCSEDEAKLIDTVGIVFHAAATVRFDDPLRSAILLNTRGTREIVELAKKMKRLQVLQYVSTTYCHTEVPVLEEKFYRSHLNWRTVIQMAEREDVDTLQAATYKVLGTHPNTYTFTKALGEDIIHDARNDIPVIIVRPAVVVSSLQEPFPGWLDNLYGPFSIWAGILKGVMQYLYVDSSVALSYSFVDWAIRGMLITAWSRAMSIQVRETPEDVDVVNIELSAYTRFSYSDMCDVKEQMMKFISMAIRYPRAVLTRCYPHYWLGVFFHHFLYGTLVDTLLKLTGRKPRLMSIYRKAYIACDALTYFMMKEFPVATKNLFTIEKLIPFSERSAFTTEINSSEDSMTYSLEKYSVDCVIGISKYVFKEKVTVAENEKRLTKLFLFEMLQYALGALIVYWLVRTYFVPKLTISSVVM